MIVSLNEKYVMVIEVMLIAPDFTDTTFFALHIHGANPFSTNRFHFSMVVAKIFAINFLLKTFLQFIQTCS